MSVFDDIEVGQQVVIYSPYNRQELQVYTVEKVTQTQITVNGKRYRKSDGHELGSHSFGHYIETKHYPHYGLMTPEEAAKENIERGKELKRQRLANKIRGVTFRDKSYEVLVKVAKLLEVEIE